MPSSETGRPRYPSTRHTRGCLRLGAAEDDVAELGHDRREVAQKPDRLTAVGGVRDRLADDPRGVHRSLVANELHRLEERERPGDGVEVAHPVALEEQFPVADVVEADARADQRLAQDLEGLEIRPVAPAELVV